VGKSPNMSRDRPGPQEIEDEDDHTSGLEKGQPSRIPFLGQTIGERAEPAGHERDRQNSRRRGQDFFPTEDTQKKLFMQKDSPSS